jgi:hypothetical protein
LYADERGKDDGNPVTPTGVGSVPLPFFARAVLRLLERLYRGRLLPTAPISRKHIANTDRNTLIRKRYEDGETVSDLARIYAISPQRVWQIVSND